MLALISWIIFGLIVRRSGRFEWLILEAWSYCLRTRRCTRARTSSKLTAKPDDDGSVTVQFGGCENASCNCISIAPDWSYMVHLFRPRKEVLDGTWKFSEVQRER